LVLASRPEFNSIIQIDATCKNTRISSLSLRERARVRGFDLTHRNIAEHPDQSPLPLGEG